MKTSARLPTQKMAIVVPIRGRPKEEKIFVSYMKLFLMTQDAAKNRGFDCFCFHDLDTIPTTPKIRYECPSGIVPYHLTPSKLHPHVHYNDSWAGNSCFTVEQFEKVNGFSSDIWGWGTVDDNMVKRLVAKNLWPPQTPTEVSEPFAHLDCEQDERVEWEKFVPEDFTHVPELLMTDLGHWGLNTSHSEVAWEGTIDDSSDILIKKVKMLLTCNQSFTPWCMNG
eukprot:jgi/Galph1/1316/GphlegSOOS_G6002.1